MRVRYAWSYFLAGTELYASMSHSVFSNMLFLGELLHIDFEYTFSLY